MTSTTECWAVIFSRLGDSAGMSCDMPVQVLQCDGSVRRYPGWEQFVFKLYAEACKAQISGQQPRAKSVARVCIGCAVQGSR